MHVQEIEINQFITAECPWNNVKCIKGIRDSHVLSTNDGVQIEMYAHDIAVNKLNEVWYTENWKNVNNGGDKLCIKLLKIWFSKMKSVYEWVSECVNAWVCEWVSGWVCD